MSLPNPVIASLGIRIVLLIAAFAGCAAAPGAGRAGLATGLLFRRLESGSRYAVYVPRNYDGSKVRGWPVVVFLHGKGECGEDGQRQAAVGVGPAALLDPVEWHCIILMPQKPDPEKQWEEYDGMVMDELAAVRREWHIDPARITLTGLSQGGHGSWVLGSRHTQVFAAIAPICGYGDPIGIVDELAVAGTPVWAFHGLKDDAVKPEETQRMVDALRAAHPSAGPRGPEPRLTLYPDLNHGCWDQAYRHEGLGTWLLQQRRNQANADDANAEVGDYHPRQNAPERAGGGGDASSNGSINCWSSPIRRTRRRGSSTASSSGSSS